jgi:hypothetical protein
MLLFWSISALAGVFLFGFGYYLGRHVGETAHVRQHLRQVREQRRLGQTPAPWPEERDPSWSRGW